MCELNKPSVKQWQSEWESSSKGALTKLFFSKFTDRLKTGIKATPKFSAMVTEQGNIKTYFYKYKIIGSPMCSY
jgi:hypothetical protein